MIVKIESRQNDKIKDVVKLYQSSERNKRKEFLVEGFHLFEMALHSNVVKSIFVLKEIKDIPQNIIQYIVTPEIMEKISSVKTPQGIVSLCSMKEEKEITSNRVLYLDDISDPGNMGTLLRTALAFGYKDVIVSNGCCSVYNEKVLLASQGAIFDLNISTDRDNILSILKGYSIYATEIKGSKNLNEIKASCKHVLVLGNEAHGVSEKILSLASERIRIDIKDIESLNVAVAGGIAMYHLSK